MMFRLAREHVPPCVFLLLLGSSALIAGDRIVLVDGSLLEGEVRELGGNSVEVVLAGGSKSILRRQIESVELDDTRSTGLVAESDFVVRQDLHRIVGEVKLLSGGKRVQVKLPSGSSVVLPRDEVQRIVHKGEPIHTDTAVYTAELGRAIDEAFARLSTVAAEDHEELVRLEGFLGRCGLFAIGKVRERLSKIESGDESPAAAVLWRLDRAYRLKEKLDSDLQNAEPRVYELFGADYSIEPSALSEQQRLEAKRDFMLFAFQRFTEEATPLAVFIASDSSEDGILRAWSVEFLRRLQKNRELVEIYESATGQAQVAAAVALAQNQILLGVPAMIETLELASPELRSIAVKTLRSSTGMTFGFHPGGAPVARREAVGRWWDWWKENEQSIVEKTREQLASDKSVTPERRLAEKIWKEATAGIAEGQYAYAEARLREAAEMDPTFYPARLNLAIVLYAHRNKPDEAIRYLRELAGHSTLGVTFQQQGWAYLHLGNCLRLTGELRQAVEAYRQCLARQPENLEALIELGQSEHVLATQGDKMTVSERRERLVRALRYYSSAADMLQQVTDELVALRAEDLPLVDSLPFDRREYNRSVFSVRRDYRYRSADLRFRIAKVNALLGDRDTALATMVDTIAGVTAEQGDRWRTLETAMRTYLGLLYEEKRELRRALREYLQVLRQLDSEHLQCRQGVERLKRLVRSEAAEQEGFGN